MSPRPWDEDKRSAPRVPEDVTAVLERISDAVVALDRNWVYTYVNAKAAAIFGRRREDLIGKHIWTEFPEGVGQKFHHAYERALASGEPVFLEEYYPPYDRWFENRIYPSPDGLTIYFQDVTDRKREEARLHELLQTQVRVQQALREREERLRTIIDNEPECVKVVGADGVLLEMNAAGLAMLEVDSLADAQARGLLSFILPEHRDAFRDLHRRVLSGQRAVLEFEVSGLRGTRRWLETHAAPLADGDATLLLGVTRDVTERRHAEQQRRLVEARLRAAERMEVVGQLAGGVAHDFNNIVTIINSATELAMEAVDPDSKVYGDLQEVRAAGQRAAALTGQLLAFARHQIFAPEVFDLHDLIAHMRSMLARVVREDVDLCIASPAGPCLVQADRSQLERVVVNLVVNARDAMPHGGALTLEIAPITLPASEAAMTTPPLPAGAYVRLRVTDTGEGMDEQTRARAFEPFFTTKERGRGTGLGLSSSYGIVAQSGGAVTVSSAPGRGSTFDVYLPAVSRGLGATGGGRTTERPQQGRETILIVDDEESLVGVARRMLESVGYVTLTATGAREALRIAAQTPGPIHLLVTDVVMPEMSGTQLASRFTDLHPETRVLFTSGYADDALLRDAMHHRSAALLGKPYAASDLRRRVRDLLDRGPETG